MKPTRFPSANKVYTEPGLWNSDRYGSCANLDVREVDGTCTSCWKPTWKERLFIAIGKPVFLTVVGRQPPVALGVDLDG